MNTLSQSNEHLLDSRVAVVIPCYKVAHHIDKVVSQIGTEVTTIYIVDDQCPEHTGKYLKKSVTDTRVKILIHETNQGVGGATMTGYREAIKDQHDIIVKIDGDGQMDPTLIHQFIQPIISGKADYTKGNRFYNIEDMRTMPTMRIIGNMALSFFSKLSSGYWQLIDPTNGYTAISGKVAKHLPLNKINKRYFFESDLLFHLNIMRCVVVDIPMTAIYADEISNLKIHKILFKFFTGHIKNFHKRIFYNYFLRGFSIASLELLCGILFMFSGLSIGIINWIKAAQASKFASSGTVMLAALPIIIGFQLLLAFLNFDIVNSPRQPVSKSLE